jgi:ectoine hydroxylase-related dioxygenase (phytanoyl-CoA dioxygenase family)
VVEEAERWATDYERDGYLVVEDCVDTATLLTLRAKVERIMTDPDHVPERLRRYMDVGFSNQEATLREVMELPLFDPYFAQFIAYGRLLDVLQVLFDSAQFHFHNYKLVSKEPGPGGSIAWHRDLPFLYHSTPNLITAMVCLNGMTEENGATVVLPGSHRLVGEDVSATDTSISEGDLPADMERRAVVCGPGAVMFFHVNVIHGGGANLSAEPRRNVIGIWAGPNTYPTGPSRYAYQGLYPRSSDPALVRQCRMALSIPDPPVAGVI